MNISGLIGLLAAFGLIIYGIAFGKTIDMGKLQSFLDPQSFAITFGGTLACLLFAFPLSTIVKIPKQLKMVFFPPKYNPRKYITEIVDYAKIARSKGLLALEDSANQCKDPFMKSGLMLIVDANDAEKVRGMLTDAMDFMSERHDAARSFYERGASAAPAFGMLGTLIGLINMLGGLGGDSGSAADQIGGGMAVALITTFYGSFLSNVIFVPLATRLKSLHEEELLCMQIITEGILAIQAGLNPGNIEEKLQFLLPKAKNAAKGKTTKAAQ